MSYPHPPREGTPAPIGPEADPGYLRSIGAGGVLGPLRLLGLVMTVMPLLLLVMSVVTIGTGVAWSIMGLYLPSVGLVLVGLAAVLPPIRPVPPGTPPEDAAALSADRLRGAVTLRLALCEVPALLGFVSMFAFDDSLVPFLVGLAISMIGLFTVGLPTTGVIERFRGRLERDGATSYLWYGLLRGVRTRR